MTSRKPVSASWKLFLALSFVAGLFLRTLYVEDMEYKEDEQYNYTQSQAIGTTAPWPAYGIASGVYIVNPGMSIWVFAGLAKITGAKTPTELARSVQLFAILGISLLLVFAFYFVEPAEREPWFWSFALAMVNPFAILYQRKLWPEPFLPFFSILMLMGWWKRDKRWGAFLWGIIGALIGQIHMSGFFLAAGFFLWTLCLSTPEKRRRVRWRYWLIGSIIGAIPLLPWLQFLLTHSTRTALENGWNEALQFKYWVFWITDAFGVHLGNTLGIYIGDSQWEQLSDFVRYPLIAGHATYIVGLAHLGIFSVMGWTVLNLVRVIENDLSGHSWATKFNRLGRLVIGRKSETAFGQNAAFWSPGILMTLMNLQIRRYYLSVVFPWDFVWLARAALRNEIPNGSPQPDSIRASGLASAGGQSSGRRWLAALWAFQLVISADFVHYIHVNQGSPKGDYGDAYHVIISKPVPNPVQVH